MRSNHLDASLARWGIIHFAPVVLSSGHATDVCRNRGDSHEAHAALSSSLPCPSKLNDRVLDLMKMAAEVLGDFDDPNSTAEPTKGPR